MDTYMDMSSEEVVIYNRLKSDPGTFHTSNDGNHMYLLSGEGDAEVMIRFDREDSEKNFNDQTNYELQKRLQDFILDAMNRINGIE